jgi:ATP-dependent RNA helicase RhlE
VLHPGMIESWNSLSQFTDFGLAAPILKALQTEGYITPTPIQAQAIPHVMAGRDLLGIAQTGTGKTAAFALPILHRLAANPQAAQRRGCRTLVLSPTRELATQIAESFRSYGCNLRLTRTTVFGGVGSYPQVRAMAVGVDILVATPGRLMDLVGQGAIRLETVEVLVLDEADQMLDMGFIHAIRKIVGLLPRQRQTLFFSATMPDAIADLARGMLTDPIRVEVAPVATTADRVEQRVMFVEKDDKRHLLVELLKDPAIERALVFARTKHGADRVARHLHEAGIGVDAIHGNKSQGQRERALSAFKNGRARVLVATDIAARGIDVDGVSHVVNFDLPNVPESYVHRIGRTARAGHAGVALSFCDREERGFLRDIERLIRQSVPVVADHPYRSAAPAASPSGGPARRPGRPAARSGPGGPGHHGAGYAGDRRRDAGHGGRDPRRAQAAPARRGGERTEAGGYRPGGPRG